MPEITELLNTNQAAALFGTRPRSIRRWVLQKRIPFTRTPTGLLRFNRAELEQMLAVRKVLAESAR